MIKHGQIHAWSLVIHTIWYKYRTEYWRWVAATIASLYIVYYFNVLFKLLHVPSFVNCSNRFFLQIYSRFGSDIPNPNSFIFFLRTGHTFYVLIKKTQQKCEAISGKVKQFRSYFRYLYFRADTKIAPNSNRRTSYANRPCNLQHHSSCIRRAIFSILWIESFPFSLNSDAEYYFLYFYPQLPIFWMVARQ